MPMVPLNNKKYSMPFHGTWRVKISITRAVPWNSMELRVRQFRWHERFHGIEFHGTWTALISMTRAVPWDSMVLGVRQFRWHEQFHGTWSMRISLTRAVPWNSMVLDIRQFRLHGQFHGIPWNLECANFADTSGSMEFHGTWSAPISLTRAVLWNSMELKNLTSLRTTQNSM